MDNTKEYIEMALDKCPHCGSRNIERASILETIGGGHMCCACACYDCGKKWVSDDRIRINWQIPPAQESAS